ncbi:hypothetical protein [Lutibacter sp.]|uniref:hypothetical protein n=1 Tax=Lutibacter sp. TaxID=1925666 RepID=UPI002733B563|nr:hypothetical protein [Lutibacter sp.]MDP3314433.1 hypothetical protein [Lutibacter sp.]
MENPFKQIGTPLKEVPFELKKKVMADVAAVKLIMDVTKLFTSNYAGVAESFFKKKKNNKK